MKRIAIYLLFSFFPLLTASADTPPEIDKLLDYSVTLEKLSGMSPAQLDKLISDGRYIIIEGTVAAITEIERSDNDLVLDLHVVSGRWMGLDSVEDYKCIVNINGLDWEPRFPRRTPRNITDELILQNDRILVLGKVSSYVMEDSELRPVVDATYIRKIQ